MMGHDSQSAVQPLWVQALVAANEPRFRELSSIREGRVEIDLDRIMTALPMAVCVENWTQKTLTCANQRALTFWKQFLVKDHFDLSDLAERVSTKDHQIYQTLRQQIFDVEHGSSVRGTFRVKDIYGSFRWVDCWLSVLSRTKGELPERVLWCTQDVTEDKRREFELRQALYTDSLTGLYNRTYFDAELARLNGGREYPVGIIMIDVDRLKSVNDSLGHSAGDNLLRRLGAVLKGVFRQGDVIARIGGDEFAVLLPRFNEQVAQVAVERIRHRIQQSNRSFPRSRLEISIGMAVARQGGSLGRTMQQADQRMYEQKARRKDQKR